MNPLKDLPPDEGAAAALALCGALIVELVKKGSLEIEEANAIFAVAAATCEGSGLKKGAAALRDMCPTSNEVDAVAWMKSGGGEILQ